VRRVTSFSPHPASAGIGPGNLPMPILADTFENRLVPVAGIVITLLVMNNVIIQMTSSLENFELN
jgi:hypothetical protein